MPRTARRSAALQALGSLGVRSRYRRRGPVAGTRPGAFVVPEGAPPPRIRVTIYDAERCHESETTDPASLHDAAGAPGVTWIDVEGFGDGSALTAIRDTFAIHPLAMADVVNVPQRPKLEDYGDQHLIVMRMARVTAERDIDLEQVSLIVGAGWVMTFQERPGDVFDPIRERLRSGAGALRRMAADYLVYSLLDAVVDGYFAVLEELGALLEALEEEVIEKPQRATLARIHAVRRTLLELHRTEWGQREMLSRVLRDESAPVGEAVRVYVRDVYDHAVQILDVTETYRDLAVGLLDIYLSNVSHRTNEIMKTLTVMASIFIPLTFIAGIYGMNFDHMPELHWRWGYAAVWALMAGVCVGLLVWFRRRGWLGRG